jgi:hypothetical protein
MVQPVQPHAFHSRPLDRIERDVSEKGQTDKGHKNGRRDKRRFPVLYPAHVKPSLQSFIFFGLGRDGGMIGYVVMLTGDFFYDLNIETNSFHVN